LRAQAKTGYGVSRGRAGELLLAGRDPTGYGGVAPGFGNQPNMELPVKPAVLGRNAAKLMSCIFVRSSFPSC
jgi:hypothetical protein